VVSKQDFKQRDAAAILSVGVANTHTRGVTETIRGILSLGAAATATDVILGGVSEYF
jgi:hypothetical protein